MCETSDADDCRALEREQRCEHDCDRAREDLVAFGASQSDRAQQANPVSDSPSGLRRDTLRALGPGSHPRRGGDRIAFLGSSVPRRVGEQVKGAGALDRLSARPHVELGVEMLHVRLDSVHRHVELVSDLSFGEVGG